MGAARKKMTRDRILHYLQSNKLTHYSFIDTDRRLETPDTETEEFFIHGTASSIDSSYPPSPGGMMRKGGDNY